MEFARSPAAFWQSFEFRFSEGGETLNLTRRWLIGYIVLYGISLFVFPMTSRILTLAVILAMLIEVPTRLFKKKEARSAAALASGIGLLVLSIYLISSAIPMVISNVRALGNEIDSILESERFLRILDRLPPAAAESIHDFLLNLNDIVTSIVVRGAQEILSNIAGWLTGAILLIIGSVFVLRKKRLIAAKLVSVLFPRCDHERLCGFISRLNRDLQGYIFQRTLIAAVVGVTIGIGSWIMGIDYALFFAILGAITNFIPYVGVVITGIPFILVGNASLGLWGVFGVIVILVISGVLDGWVMTPLVMSNRLKMNWFLILVAVIAFGEFLGVFGMIVAIPVLLFVRRFWADFVINGSN